MSHGIERSTRARRSPRGSRRLARRRRFAPAAAVALLAATLLPAGVRAQGGGFTAGAGAHVEYYTFLDPDAVGAASLSLVTLPFGARYIPWSRLRLEVSGAFARGSLVRADETDATIAGLTDTELRAALSLGRDLATVSLVVLAPTGHFTHTLEEAEVAGAIASDLLPFRVSNWGAGGGIGLATTIAVPVEGYGVGISAGYAVASEFDPLESEEMAYRPGDELRVQLALDRVIGRSAKASLVLGMQRYGDDELGGQNLYRSGDRYQATGSLSFAAGPGSLAVVYLGLASRDGGRFLAVDERETARQLLLLGGGGLRVPLEGWTLVPSADLRVLQRSDDVGNGYILGVGTSAEWRRGAVTLVPSVRSRFGMLRPFNGLNSTVWGAEIGFTIRGAGARP